MAINKEEFHAEKSRYQQETEAARKEQKQAQEKLQEMILDNTLRDAFSPIVRGVWDV